MTTNTTDAVTGQTLSADTLAEIADRKARTAEIVELLNAANTEADQLREAVNEMPVTVASHIAGAKLDGILALVATLVTELDENEDAVRMLDGSAYL